MNTPTMKSAMVIKKAPLEYYARKRAALTSLRLQLGRALSTIEKYEKAPEVYLSDADALLGVISPHLPIMLKHCYELLEIIELRAAAKSASNNNDAILQDSSWIDDLPPVTH